MVQYIYFVKCPDCDDEPFDFFDEAETYAISLLDKKPIISQTEVCRNDFGECTDSRDLGTVWSWQDLYKDTEELSTDSVFTKDYFDVDCDNDPEFAALDNSLDVSVINSEVSLDEGLEYEFKPTELQKAKAEVFKLNSVQRFKEDETLPQIYALYKELCAADEEGGYSPTKNFITQGQDFLRFYNDFQKLKTQREIEIKPWHDDEKRDIITGAASINSIKFKSNAAKDKLMAESACKVSDRKPIPAGMTLKDLVEALEENEDTVECACCQELYPKEDCMYDEKHGWLCETCQDEAVECTWCEELFDRSECRNEVNLGWLCSRCEAAIKSRGETLTFEEGNYWDCFDEEVDSEVKTKEALIEDVAFNPKSTIELHYEEITAPVVTRVIPATYWDPEEEITEDVTDSFDFAVTADDLATTIWEKFLTDEDVASVPGGLDALADDEAWYRYLAEHFDDLVEKYNTELLNYYEDDAIEAASEKFQDNYDNYEPDYDHDLD
jgi:hypothetical protein